VKCREAEERRVETVAVDTFDNGPDFARIDLMTIGELADDFVLPTVDEGAAALKQSLPLAGVEIPDRLLGEGLLPLELAVLGDEARGF